MLRAVQVVVDEGLAKPILIGRPAVIERRIERYGLRIKPGVDFEIVNPESDDALPRLLDRVLPADAAQGRVAAIRQDRDAPPADADRRDDDPHGRRRRHAVRHLRHASAHRHYVDQVIGLREGVHDLRGDERA